MQRGDYFPGTNGRYVGTSPLGNVDWVAYPGDDFEAMCREFDSLHDHGIIEQIPFTEEEAEVAAAMPSEWGGDYGWKQGHEQENIEAFYHAVTDTFGAGHISKGETQATIYLGDRYISFGLDSWGGRVTTSFGGGKGGSAKHSVEEWDRAAPELQTGTLDMMRSLKKFLGNAGGLGLGINYIATEDKEGRGRARLYEKALKSAGFEQTDIHTKETAGGAVHFVDWKPIPGRAAPIELAGGGKVDDDPTKSALPGQRDKIPAELEPGEVVIPREDVAALQSLITTGGPEGGSGINMASSPSGGVPKVAKGPQGSEGLAKAIGSMSMLEWSGEEYAALERRDQPIEMLPMWRDTSDRFHIYSGQGEDWYHLWVDNNHHGVFDDLEQAKSAAEKMVTDALGGGGLDWRPDSTIPEDYYAMSKGGMVPDQPRVKLATGATQIGNSPILTPPPRIDKDKTRIHPAPQTMTSPLNQIFGPFPQASGNTIVKQPSPTILLPGQIDAKGNVVSGSGQDYWSIPAPDDPSSPSAAQQAASAAALMGVDQSTVPPAAQLNPDVTATNFGARTESWTDAGRRGRIAKSGFSKLAAFGINALSHVDVNQGLHGIVGSAAGQGFSHLLGGRGVSGAFGDLLSGGAHHGASEGHEELIDAIEKLTEAVNKLTEKMGGEGGFGIQPDGSFKPMGFAYNASPANSHPPGSSTGSGGDEKSDKMLREATEVVSRIVASGIL